MTSRTPTAEQAAIIAAFKTGHDLVVEARAGTGKTTTLKMLAEAQPGRRGLYIAYNRAIADDAKKTFPASVKCSTAHGLAYGAVVTPAIRKRLNGPRVPARQVCRILRINDPLKVEDKILAPEQVARLVMAAVGRFANSADPEPQPWHVPTKPGLDSGEAKATLRAAVTPLARKAWEDLTRADGQLKFEHGHYLKMWQLSRPVLKFDYVMLDEAQDANPVIASVVDGQNGTQKILVGDACQAIYGWNGAVDAMSKFRADHRVALSQSFRFGPLIAAEANKWLTVLESLPLVTGFERVNSAVTESCGGDVDAVLCRTNAQAVAELIAAHTSGRKAALVGGGAEVKRLAQAAITLKAGLGCDHPELFAFRTWGEVQDYADHDPGGSDLKVFVKLIDDHGPDEVIGIIDNLSQERYADVVVSTAHKAKGREWDSVRIAGDFHEPKKGPDGELGEISREDAMLAYVAVTRAKHTLDRSGLAWVDKYLPGAETEPES
jgi:UvrD/REP helicase N-terminal domain/UvrD-like helicase C-terminal domain/DEAD/DEAH box helicase